MSLFTWLSIKWWVKVLTSDYYSLLGFMPTWLPKGIMIFAVALFFLEVILESIQQVPYFYRLPIRIITIIIFASGAYLKGAQAVIFHDKAVIKEVTDKQVIVTTNIKNTYTKQLNAIKSTNAKLRQKINTKDDGDCKLPKSFIELHNNSSQGRIPNPTWRIDVTPPKITAPTK